MIATTCLSEEDRVALAREIAFRMAPDSLLDAEDVGVMIGCKGRYVTERYAGTPGFPEAIRLTAPGGKRGHPKWMRGEVQAWIEAHRNGASKKGGRPRKDPWAHLPTA